MAGKSNGRITPYDLTFLGGDTRLARVVGRPVTRFLHVQAAGGIVLLIAAAVALIWANSPWKESYADLIHTHIDISIGSFQIFEEDLEHFVSDALMAIFFFVVGLEIKREVVVGQLRDRKAAMFPAIAAIGGMAVPALIYTAFNLGGPGVDGWGIPTATDIAFAVGVVSLLGDRVPSALKVFLLSLAIVDDLLAIMVIAIFYTDNLDFAWLAAAAALLVVIALLKQARVWYIPLYVILGFFVWLAVFKSGVHATIAGVALGLLTPARPLHQGEKNESLSDFVSSAGHDLDDDETQALAFLIRENVSVLDRLITWLHPWTSFLIIPLFALVNAGVEFSSDAVSNAATGAVGLGVFMGLIAGKTIGVGGFAWAADKLNLASLPPGVTPLHMVGISLTAAIGFTVSIFVTGLAFDDPALIEESKMAIIFASLVAAVGGAAILWIASNRPGAQVDDMGDVGDSSLEEAVSS